MKERYYELIDERVFEQELENGLRLFIIPNQVFKRHLSRTLRNLVH